jgi:hypothetical protein
MLGRQIRPERDRDLAIVLKRHDQGVLRVGSLSRDGEAAGSNKAGEAQAPHEWKVHCSLLVL